jgi:enoyl-CoA hydratase/carnithine racemase
MRGDLPGVAHMRFDTLRFETEGNLGLLTLDRPERLNAISKQMTLDLAAVVTELESNDEVRVVIVTGEGRAFCAGADIKERAENPDDFSVQRTSRLISPTFRRIERLPQVTIAAINGPAAGGGLELALACDLRIASTTARMGLPEVTLGILPGAGGTQRLPRLIGPARAKELMYFGKLIDASKAHAWGIVNEVVVPASLMSKAREWAATLLERPPISLANIKAAVNTAMDTDLDTGISFEQRASTIVAMTEDRAEGYRAFVEKRKPKFRGR